jgi:four helix bundle protein
MRDFKRLDVWQRARTFTGEVYRHTRQFPKDEIFGLRSQIRRAAASIGANIAEGAGRSSDSDYARFVRYAAGSVNEVEHHIILATDLGFLDSAQGSSLIGKLEVIRKMLTRLNERLTGAEADRRR